MAWATAWPSLCLVVLCVACRDDGSKTHVYRAPRPVQAPPTVIHTPPVPELPIGTMGAEARITAVTAVATGAPVALTQLTEPFSVLTLVGRGPGGWAPDAGARIELVIDGPTDTTLVLPLKPPAAVIIAHPFRVAIVRSGGAGLRSGDYSAFVRLVMRGDETLAMSVPIYFVVAR